MCQLQLYERTATHLYLVPLPHQHDSSRPQLRNAIQLASAPVSLPVSQAQVRRPPFIRLTVVMSLLGVCVILETQTRVAYVIWIVLDMY